MDGVSLASGIAGLISLAIQVSGTITEYATAVRDRSKNAKELLDELALLSDVLGQLKDFLLSDHGRGRHFDEGSVLDKAVADCKKRIERIQEKLRPVGGSKLARAWDKMTWPFEQKDVLQMVENLRRFTHTFQFAVSIKGCEILSKTSAEASESLKDMLVEVRKVSELTKHIPGLEAAAKESIKTSAQLQDIVDLVPMLLQQAGQVRELSQANKLREEREYALFKSDVLNWLAPESSLQRHPDIQRQRAPNAGQWFLQHTDFVEWIEESHPLPDLLCTGGPGRGKTILCSLVIDHLRKKFQDSPDVAIIHYYCDIAEQQAQSPMNLTLCILRQLCDLSQTIPPAVAEFYAKTRNGMRDSFWSQELQGVLQRVVATFTRCFLIIDALDETEPKDQRRGFFEVLQVMRGSNRMTRIFATTRPHQGIELKLQAALQIEVSADETDLREYLHRKISEHPHAGELLDDDLEDEIVSQLCSHADGMFLLPALQIDDILDQVTKADVRRALGSLSTTLEGVFGTTLDRIRSSKKQERELACATLMWLAYAKCHLTVAELQHALGVRFESIDVNLEDVPPLHRILDSCRGLVRYDKDSPYLRFVHGTLYEHLKNEGHGLFSSGETEVTRKCLKYMLYESARLHPSINRTDFITGLEKLPFLEYASTFWGYHARSLEIHMYEDLALLLLNDSTCLLVAARIRDSRSQEFRRKWKERMWAWAFSSGSGGGISLAAGFGLANLTRRLVDQSPSPVLTARNMFGSTPLHECAMHGYYDTARVLIQNSAPILDFNNGNATPFYLAVSYEQLDIAQLLLDHNRGQLDTRCKDGYTALHKASDAGSEIMVSFLLQAGALVGARDDEGMTPLHLASRRGYLTIVQLLVESGAPVNSRSRDGFTPLDYAATGGYVGVVQYLLGRTANLSNKNRFKWTALHRAARAGRAEVVRVLLDNGAEVLALDRAGRIPLTLAAQSGSRSTVDALLEHQPETVQSQLQHKENKGSSAKIVAFYTAHFALHKYLRDRENDLLGHDPIFNPGPDLTFPLMHAIEIGSLTMVQALLEAQPELMTKPDSSGQTPLHTAFIESQREITEYILEQGVSINIRGYHDWAPLHIAASLGSLRMICLALTWGADIDAVTESKQTALHKAASAGQVDVIAELMACGCDPATPNHRGMNVIHVAAHQNFLEGIREILRPERNNGSLVLATDHAGRTPKSWAEFSGHLEVAAFLKLEERKARGKVSNNTSTMQTSSRMSRANSQGGTYDLSNSYTNLSLSRTSTLEPLSRTSTNTNNGASNSVLLTPPAKSTSKFHQQSTASPFDDEYDENVYGSPSLSPCGTPTPTLGSSTPKLGTPIPLGNTDIDQIQQRYTDLELLESDR